MESKNKLCPACQKHRKRDQFKPDKHAATGLCSYCIDCSKIIQAKYREQYNKRKIGYEDVTIIRKTCTRCHKRKSAKDFYLDKKVKSGLKSSCKECCRIDINKANKEREHYRITNPVEWYEYYKNYVKQYKADPLVSLRQYLSKILCQFVKDGEYIKPRIGYKCECCNSKCAKAPKAYFQEKDIRKMFKLKRSSFTLTFLLEKVQWICNDCLYKKRK
jgi:hypothetical protein